MKIVFDQSGNAVCSVEGTYSLQPGQMVMEYNLSDIREMQYLKFINGSIVLSKPVEQTKKEQWEKIKAIRDSRKSQGGVKVGTKWFHSDDPSRIQQLGLVMMGASIPANTQWKTMDGSFVTMTQTLAGQIFQASAANDMAIFAAAETHKVAMEASADPASYDFSTGWPKAFGE